MLKEAKKVAIVEQNLEIRATQDLISDLDNS